MASGAVVPATIVLWAIAIVAGVTLGVLGAAGARAGGAPVAPAIVRVVLLGSVAMAITAGVGHLFHITVG